MNLFLLGGNHKSNKEWIEDVEKALRHMFESTKIQYYDHWSEKAASIDFNLEFEKLKSSAEGVKDLVIFAKSVGTLLALKGLYKGEIAASKCIFVGTPINLAKAYGFDIDIWLQNYLTPTLFIQKKEDPAMSFFDLYRVLLERNVSSYNAIKIPGEDHEYDDIRKLKSLIRKFLSDD